MKWTQRDWLWGLVHLAEEKFNQVEAHLLGSFEGARNFGALVVQTRVLAQLAVLYIRTHNEAGLNQTLLELMAVLGRSNGQCQLADVGDWLQLTSTTGDLETLEGWIH